LERLEEYSSCHPESFDELGNWYADRFERCWHAYLERSMLARLDDDRRSLIAAMYANGMIGGEDLRESIEKVHDQIQQAKRETLAALRGEKIETDHTEELWWKKGGE
jgi:hypothetical protein